MYTSISSNTRNLFTVYRRSHIAKVSYRRSWPHPTPATSYTRHTPHPPHPPKSTCIVHRRSHIAKVSYMRPAGQVIHAFLATPPIRHTPHTPHPTPAHTRPHPPIHAPCLQSTGVAILLRSHMRPAGQGIHAFLATPYTRHTPHPPHITTAHTRQYTHLVCSPQS